MSLEKIYCIDTVIRFFRDLPVSQCLDVPVNKTCVAFLAVLESHHFPVEDPFSFLIGSGSGLVLHIDAVDPDVCRQHTAGGITDPGHVFSVNLINTREPGV